MVPRIDFPNIWVQQKYSWTSRVPRISETGDKSPYLWSYAEFARSLLFLRGMWQVLLCSTGEKIQKKIKQTKIAIVGCCYLEVLSWKSKGGSPPLPPPPSIKALLRDSQSPSIIHCIRPYQGLIGGVGIVPLDFHDD